MKIKKTVRVEYSLLYEELIGKIHARANESNGNIQRQILKAVEREKELICMNPHRGIQISKSKIPHEYVELFEVTNLWKINLPGYWRIVYTIVGNEHEIIPTLIEIMDHDTYNKKFGYRKN